jgi:hypothetical protein
MAGRSSGPSACSERDGSDGIFGKDGIDGQDEQPATAAAQTIAMIRRAVILPVPATGRYKDAEDVVVVSRNRRLATGRTPIPP